MRIRDTSECSRSTRQSSLGQSTLGHGKCAISLVVELPEVDADADCSTADGSIADGSIADSSIADGAEGSTADGSTAEGR